MNKDYCYIIYSNSHYNYLWNILNEYPKKIKNKIYLCIDENNIDFNFDNNFELIYYPKNLNYPRRLLHILDKIDYKYILLIHDVDLILNLNENNIDLIISMMNNNNIDRVSLGIFNNSKNIISNSNINLCNINDRNISKSFFTPFDYAPSLYKKDKIKSLYSIFIDHTYVTLEQSSSVQDYVNINFNVFGIFNKNIELVYHRGFVYCTNYNFLHITVGGKLLHLDDYFDLKETLILYVEKYNLQFIEKYEKSFLNKNEF